MSFLDAPTCSAVLAAAMTAATKPLQPPQPMPIAQAHVFGSRCCSRPSGKQPKNCKRADLQPFVMHLNDVVFTILYPFIQNYKTI